MRHLFVGIICFAAIGGMTVNLATAQQGKGKAKSGTGQKKDGGQKGQKKGKAGNQPSSAAMATRMIGKFDRNGDKSLNAEELTAALEDMRQQRRSAQNAGKGGAKSGGKGGARGGGKSGGKGKGGRGKGGKGGRRKGGGGQ